MRKNNLFLTVLVLFVFCRVLPLHAWYPISHYVITKYAAQKKGIPEEVKNYANLPDYVDSSEPHWVVARRIGHYFTWSHAAIDLGNDGLVPKVPEYPDDGRYPGLGMQNLLKYKLKDIKPSDLSDMQNTVNGFRAHNAADRVVHWDFFLGGDKDRWIVHHGLKECLAEYNILRLYGYGGNEDIMLTQNGRINRATLNTSVIPATGPGFKGNAELMHIAQKVFRKNRRVMREGKDDQLDVQNVAEIKRLIKKQDTNPLTKSVWATWEWGPFNLVDNFTVYEWNTTTNQYDEITIDPDTPKNNRQEYQNLLYYQLYTWQQWKTPQYPGEVGRMFGDVIAENDWKVWDDAIMRDKFDKSIDKAAEWMFPIQELIPNN